MHENSSDYLFIEGRLTCGKFVHVVNRNIYKIRPPAPTSLFMFAFSYKSMNRSTRDFSFKWSVQRNSSFAAQVKFE